MTDFYLDVKTADIFESLKGSAPFDYGPAGLVGTEGWNVDVIGDGQVKIVSWTSEGEPITEPMEGFLINLRSSHTLPIELDQYQVFPATPIRVWA